MPDRFSQELLGVLDKSVPRLRADGAAVMSDMRRIRATIVLAASGNGLVTTSDQVLLGELPIGAVFAFGILRASVSFGSSVVAIGTSKVHATNGQYRAAATYTGAQAGEVFGQTAAGALAPLSAPSRAWLTVATANLPTSGTVVIDLFFSMAN